MWALAGLWAAPRSPGSGRGLPASAAAGLSLLEMTVVLSITGLLCLVGLHNFPGWTLAGRVQRAAREVAALMEWCRWQAIEHGRAYRVQVNSDQESLLVVPELQGTSGEGDGEPVRELRLRDRFPGVVLGAASSTYRTSGCRYVDPSGVHLRDDQVRFLPHGTCDRCGSIYLMPEQDLHEPDPADQQGRTVGITLLLSTGRVQLYRYDPLGVSECPHAGAWRPLY